MNYFWDEVSGDAQMPITPTILAIGDSWFWYPFFGGSLINHLGKIVENKGHVILARGNNGAEAFDYADGKYAAIVLHSLRIYGGNLKAVFISGGGNDFAGFSDLRPLLKNNCSNETTPEGCFQGGVSNLTTFLDNMDRYYRKLIGIIYTHTTIDCKILMHSYDYARPTGKGLSNEGWLGPALDAARVPDNLRNKCMHHLIDSFHNMLLNITKFDTDHLFLIDSRGTLSDKDWANEIHPTPIGFKKIAEKCWKPMLKQINLA